MVGTQVISSIKPFDIEVACMKEGLLTSVAGSDVVRFLPPLTISDEEIEKGLAIYKKVLDAFAKQ